MRSGRITLPLAPSGELDRRGFCQLLAGCAAGMVLSSCSDSGGIIHTGPLDQPDADRPPGPDAAIVDDPDARIAATCTGSPTDVGLPSAFSMNTATLFLFSSLYVVRDAGGVFAVSSQCTHRTDQLLLVTSGHFRCPRHGAEFTYNGAIITGPVNRGLVHYSMCTMATGHLGVDPTMQVPASTRLVV